MKLLTYTYWRLFPFLLILLAGWGVLFYFTILEEVTDETDDSLENYRNILVNMALNDPTVLETEGNVMTMYMFRPITSEQAANYKEEYFDSTVYIQVEDEYEPVRVMKSCFMMPDGQFYELELKISTLEREDMIEAIWEYLLVLFLMMFISLLIMTRYVLRKTFIPLDKLMNWLRKIQPGREVPPLETGTDIKEFSELGKAAVEMGNRSYKAYIQQKQFLENASHELQTPLAIIQNKIELMADSESLDESNMQQLSEIYSTLGRTVKLNKSLLLLSRIENGQFVESEEIDMGGLISEVLEEISDIYIEKNIQINYTSEGVFTARMNRMLARILVTNLLKNAFTHNLPGGELAIKIKSSQIQISNTGTGGLDENKIFERFYHPQTANKESIGLGLSIVKTITASYGLSLTYSWNGMHSIILQK